MSKLYRLLPLLLLLSCGESKEPVTLTLLSYNVGVFSKYEDNTIPQVSDVIRTAVALTDDGHFLMVVVDGRRPGVSEGMSSRELTRFLRKTFNPRYALNMDGGGSSTLVVAGEGDPKTHVVNRPTDAKGERKVTSHFVLVHE